MNCLGEFRRLSLSLSARVLPDLSMSQGFLDVLGVFLHVSTLWWLALFIEALVLFPNNEREGRQQLAILKGNI